MSHNGHKTGWVLAFWVFIEILKITGFGLGFYSVAHVPVKTMRSDLEHLDDTKKMKEEMSLLLNSMIEARNMAFIALGMVVLAFVLETIVSRAIKMPRI